MAVAITQSPFDPQEKLAQFTAGRSDAGALASFVGYCRDDTQGHAVSELFIDHYPGFSEGEIARIASDIAGRFDVLDILVVHRVGNILPGEAIVLTAALSVHRSEAFDAVRTLMDYLKTDAPLWKKETGPGGVRWIEPTSHDRARRAAAEQS